AIARHDSTGVRRPHPHNRSIAEGETKGARYLPSNQKLELVWLTNADCADYDGDDAERRRREYKVVPQQKLRLRNCRVTCSPNRATSGASAAKLLLVEVPLVAITTAIEAGQMRVAWQRGLRHN